MEIRFSTARQYPKDDIWKAARDNGCHARMDDALATARKVVTDKGGQSEVFRRVAIVNANPEVALCPSN